MYCQTNSEIQGDGIHTLYLMNPNYAAYPDNPSAAAVILHAPPPLVQHQDFPEQTPISRLHYNMWGLDDQPQQTPRGLCLSLLAHRKSSVIGDHKFPVRLSSSPSEPNRVKNVIGGSKYLKAAQELLDEVVNVGNEAKKDKVKIVKENKAAGDETAIRSELTAAQMQEIQLKRSNLNIMLDEVERRWRQYHEQMQIVVATFEQAAGIGSARAYTQLPQKTILKQFRCLKSTISAQIKGLNKTLGHEERTEGSISRFRLQNNAWRPQRGLPERAVSVLRAWLFEHFLHPYPKDLDKKMLAKQTGLTRSQVSNWFINARVRVWKPMVEEMYLEETNNQNKISDASRGAAPSPAAELSASTITTTASASGTSNFAHLITSLNTDNLQPENNPKKPRNAVNLSADKQMTAAGDQTKFTIENYLSMATANSFSLSLALQPAESSQFLSHRNFEVGGGRINDGGRGNMGYGILDFQNRKPFPARPLPDFVA